MKIEIIHEQHRQLSTIIERADDYSLPVGQQLLEGGEMLAINGFDQQRNQLQIEGVFMQFYTRSHEAPIVTRVRSDRPYVQMHFDISGGSTTYNPANSRGKALATKAGECSLFYLPELNGHLRDARCQQSLSVEIEVAVSWIRQYLTAETTVSEQFLRSIDRAEPALLGGQNQRITAVLNQILHDLQHCPYSGQVKRLYVEGKLLLLLALQLQQATDTRSSIKTLKLSASEIQRLEALREELSNNCATHYTLADFAQFSGMNRSKMQAGFKQLFNCTLHEFLIETRMTEAHRLLIDSPENSWSIAALANHVGYKHYNHFSAAFKKRFGQVPSNFLK